jgi:hypothetical protein
MEILKRLTKAVSSIVDDEEIPHFVRLRYRDDTEEDLLVHNTRDGIRTLISELSERTDVREFWVFEQVHHSNKACPPRTSIRTSPPLDFAPSPAHI